MNYLFIFLLPLPVETAAKADSAAYGQKSGCPDGEISDYVNIIYPRLLRYLKQLNALLSRMVQPLAAEHNNYTLVGCLLYIEDYKQNLV